MTDLALFRTYEPAELGPDGYPLVWHGGVESLGGTGVKHFVRWEAGYRCVRCGHPYREGSGEWSPCDDRCEHDGPTRPLGAGREAQWRILTVHHLNGRKHDLRWWNLAALCQRCHLQIQGKVQMERVWPWEHSEWFKPYAAGWYAYAYLGENLTREETLERVDILLGLERMA